MTTLTKIIITTLLSLCLFSCNFDINLNSGVKGNGKLQTETRTVTEPFSTIKATEGLDVYVTQSDNQSIVVETDENLQELILTEVKDGVLKIHAKENIGRCSAKKITVSFKTISSIIATSGSDVISTNTIVADVLDLKTTSGSDMSIKLNTKILSCSSTSGSDLNISGITEKFNAEATSGSDIEAKDLIAQYSNVKATSGADIIVNTEKILVAKATSGGDIKYYGDPEKVDKSNNSSGSVIKR